VIIDEAQNLSLSLIEEIRILSDLHGRTSPLQVLFVGQLELRDKLKLPEMRQVDQRVSVHCSLEPLTRVALGGYVAHRLGVAGGSPDRVHFPQDALDAVYEASHGVPRLINRICDRALHHSFVGRSSTLSRAIVEAAILETGGAELPGALSAAPSTSARPVVVPASWGRTSEATPGGIDAWLTAVEVGPPSRTDGLNLFATESGQHAAPEAREPQWVLGSDVRSGSRRKRRRLPYGLGLSSLPSDLKRRSLRTAAATLIAVGALSGMGFGVSRLPAGSTRLPRRSLRLPTRRSRHLA
jgi:hypothetical protein